MKTLDPELAALRDIDRDALLEKYRLEVGREPRRKNKPWLFRRLAWRIQERRLGGLSATARTRLDELIASIEIPIEGPTTTSAAVKQPMKPGTPPIGTTYSRVWRGREVRATVVEDGFECDGVIYKSLSAVAKAITGAHWNGNLFFGITKRRTAR